MKKIMKLRSGFVNEADKRKDIKTETFEEDLMNSLKKKLPRDK
jgi:hypothetical protein